PPPPPPPFPYTTLFRSPLGQRQLHRLVEAVTQHALGGLVIEEELARRPDEEDRGSEVRRKLTHEDQLDWQLRHGVSAYAARHVRSEEHTSELQSLAYLV